jgi:hypothetical protein
MKKLWSLLGTYLRPCHVTGPVNAGTWIRSHAIPCEICCLNIGTGTGFLRVLRFYPAIIISPILIFNYTLLVPEGPKGEDLELSKKKRFFVGNRGALDRRLLRLFLVLKLFKLG